MLIGLYILDEESVGVKPGKEDGFQKVTNAILSATNRLEGVQH